MGGFFTKLFFGSAPKCKKCEEADRAMAGLSSGEISRLMLDLNEGMMSGLSKFPDSRRDVERNWTIVKHVESLARTTHGRRAAKSMRSWASYARKQAERAEGRFLERERISCAKDALEGKNTKPSRPRQTAPHIADSSQWTGDQIGNPRFTRSD
jgi:hypothetical protein